ncbi:MAG: hydroxymethylbilane synthase [Alphaproteobacteria bacterium]|nr:hydroxymethylbilane synthase [Alphaproteobacteria bacterium]
MLNKISNGKNSQASTLRIGTRASPLARKQTDIFCQFLNRHFDNISYQIIPISTQGDEIQDRPLYDIGGKGLFIKQLDDALMNDQIDIAVHSAKDLESSLHDKTKLACVLPRDDRRDCLIGHTQHYHRLNDLPPNACIGTSSPRRAAQLRAIRPDLQIIPLRGRIETRLAKMHSEKLDAIILAMAGLIRMDMVQTCNAIALPAEIMLPAASQGIIAATCHADNIALHTALYPLSDALTLDELLAERALLRHLDGSCHTAIGVFTQFRERTMNDSKRVMPASSRIQAQLSNEAGSETITGMIAGTDGQFKTPAAMGIALAKQLKIQAPHLLPTTHQV